MRERLPNQLNSLLEHYQSAGGVVNHIVFEVDATTPDITEYRFL